MRHMTKWNNFLLLDANCQRLAVSHRKIGCGSTRKITRVEVAPMHPSLEPSLPVLVVAGMKDLRTNEVLYASDIVTFTDIVTFARPDGEPAAGAGEDTAPEAAAARASRHTDNAVFHTE